MKILKFLFFVIICSFSLGLSAQTVYKTETGEKYHKATCKYLKYSKIEIDLQDAISLGYDACKVCKPTSTISKTKSNALGKKKKSTNNPVKNTSATQCTGRTKAGKRCKRMTKSANGRCYQH